MRKCSVFLSFLLAGAIAAPAQEKTDIVPRVKFEGDDFASVASVVFTETLKDMTDKIEYGENPDPRYPAGFFHTSTDSLGDRNNNYYHAMWSRDVGRGVIELSRLGYVPEARMIAEFFLSHINCGNHWGRTIHAPSVSDGRYELDGNSWILSAICEAWRVNGSKPSLGREWCRKLEPVIDWADSLSEVSPYFGLLPSMSELSGNPTTRYNVYPVFANYGMYISMTKVAGMAEASGDTAMASRCRDIAARLEEALTHLVSDGKFSYAPDGCWFNAFDSREFRAYDASDWGGSNWPIWHWTRQLPFIQDSDRGIYSPAGPFEDVHEQTYELVRQWMVKGEFFRKYGFVSNTGWTGMVGRHDETMAGYGQGFFTQAALMSDDVNTYGKCLEGIARLGYDGNVVQKLTYDRSPFVVQECFNYENYEKGLDHAFGVHRGDRRELKENPGDEGNLAQESEIIKAFSLVVGVSCNEGRLVIMPRLPWLWNKMEVRDYPYIDKNGRLQRVDIVLEHERWLHQTSIKISGVKGVDGVDVRFGPYPIDRDRPDDPEVVQTVRNASWIWVRDLEPDNTEITYTLTW